MAAYPSYFGGWDQDHHSKRAWGNSLKDPTSKTTRENCIGDVDSSCRVSCFESMKPWDQNSVPPK
jgi:hypothetical protein